MRFSIVTISFFLFMLFLTHTFLVSGECLKPVPKQYQHIKPGKVVAAYFASWDKYGRYDVADIEPVANILTHVMYAFAKPNSITGQCELYDLLADVGADFEHQDKLGGHFKDLLQLKKKFPHLKILLSVGGGLHSKDLLEVAKKGWSKRFVNSVMKILDFYDYQFEHTQHKDQRSYRFEYKELFDGIDLDWEWAGSNVTTEQVALYHDMLKMLSSGLALKSKQRQKKYILTTAIQAHPKIIKSLELSSIVNYVHWLHVMTYDYASSNKSSGVSFNAPICNPWSDLSIDSSISLLMQLGISPKKLVLGIPLYGRVFDQAQEKIGSSFEQTEKTRPLLYGQIKERYVNNSKCYRKWHKKSQVPYLYCPHDEVFVSYDDEQSVQAKVAYARAKLLKGIFFWRLSGDDEDHSLVKSVKM